MRTLSWKSWNYRTHWFVFFLCTRFDLHLADHVQFEATLSVKKSVDRNFGRLFYFGLKFSNPLFSSVIFGERIKFRPSFYFWPIFCKINHRAQAAWCSNFLPRWRGPHFFLTTLSPTKVGSLLLLTQGEEQHGVFVQRYCRHVRGRRKFVAIVASFRWRIPRYQGSCGDLQRLVVRQ